jgi:hypothetical protein
MIRDGEFLQSHILTKFAGPAGSTG